MNTSYTSQLRREFDNMALLSDIQSPVPNFITTGDGPKRQRSLEDHEGGIFSSLERPYLKKQQKTSNAQKTMMRGSGGIRVKVIQTGKIEEIDEKLFDHTKHIKEDNIAEYDELLEPFEFDLEPTAVAGRDEEEEEDDDEKMNMSKFTTDSQISNFFENPVWMGYIQEKNPEKGFGTPKPPIKGMEWRFASFMAHKVDSGTFKLKLTEMQQTGCYVCMGFGHSKHDCVTQKKCKEIFKGLPISAKLNFIVNQVLSNEKIVQHEYDVGMKAAKRQPWVLVKIVQQLAFYEIRLALKQGEANKLKWTSEIYSSIISSLAAISIQCQYCQGYGHSATDEIVKKQPKGTKIQTPEGKTKQKTKTPDFYAKQDVSCKTKVRFEQMITGEFSKRGEISGALREWSSQFKYKTDAVKGDKEILNIEMLLGNSAVMKRNTVSAKNTYMNPIETEKLITQAATSGVLKQKFEAQQHAVVQLQQQAELQEEERVKQLIADSPDEFYLKTKKGLHQTLDASEFIKTDSSMDVKNKVTKRTKDYMALKTIKAVLLGTGIDDTDLPPLKKYTLEKYPAFWFDCCSNSLQKNLRSDITRLMALTKTEPLTKEAIQQLVKGDDQDSKNFRFCMYVLARSLYKSFQLMTLRCLCADEDAYELLVFFLALATDIKLNSDSFSMIPHEHALIPIPFNEELLSILDVVEEQGDVEQLKLKYPVHNQNDKKVTDATPLDPNYLDQALILGKGSGIVVSEFRAHIRAKPEALKQYTAKKEPRIATVLYKREHFANLLLEIVQANLI